MPEDIQIIPSESGEVLFRVIGKSDDTGLMLLQRLYLLMLSDQDSAYRAAGSSYSLLRFLEGANKPSDGVMNSILAVCCSTAVAMLDKADQDSIDSFTGVSVDGAVACTLRLKDGTTVSGALNV